MQYTRKPQLVHALEVVPGLSTKQPLEAPFQKLLDQHRIGFKRESDKMKVHTLGGLAYAPVGSFIVLEESGELTVSAGKPFLENYEPVEGIKDEPQEEIQEEKKEVKPETPQDDASGESEE